MIRNDLQEIGIRNIYFEKYKIREICVYTCIFLFFFFLMMCFRTAQDYSRYYKQMLMLSYYGLKRQPFIADGFNGKRKKYPPESIRTTKQTKGLSLLYSENPHRSLLLDISEVIKDVTPERRERIRDIRETSSSRYVTSFLYPII